MTATLHANPPVRWEHLSWPEIEELVRRRPHEVALLPVGATEQHGPHLPTGTDTIIASELCDAVSARTGAPVLPAIAVGSSYGHGTVLAGTLSLTPECLSDIVRDAVEWAAASGITRVLAVNGHFGNQASLSIAGDHLRRGHPELRFGVMNWWTLSPTIAAETLADGEDVHANRAETSLMMAVAPGLRSSRATVSPEAPHKPPRSWAGGCWRRWCAPWRTGSSEDGPKSLPWPDGPSG